MSSPLSMLKKTRRTPLQGPLDEQRGRQKVPFRRNRLTEFQAALVDSADDDPSDTNPLQSSHTPASKASTSKSKAPLKKVAPPSDFELMSAMMQRVNLLEKKVRSQAQQIECKNKKISVLEKKLKVWKESGSAHDLSGREDLEKRCQQLQNQVHEMESFLNDYGLLWVGDGETSDSEDCAQTYSSGISGVRDFYMNFDLVMLRIMELNILAGEGESFVQSTATGAQLAKKEPIQLRLYSNGIVMFDGPFRSYQEHSTQQCMRDLMDGYFPSELQERFPDGVPFEVCLRFFPFACQQMCKVMTYQKLTVQVHDRRDEEFIFRLPWEKDDSSCVASSQIPGKTVTMDQFLNRLPKVVVKAGRVIDVRDSLRATLQGSSDVQSSESVVFIDTAALQAMRERLETSSSDRPSSPRDVITLKVKSEDGSHTYILKMCFSETIGHLRQYLDKHRGSGLRGYDIISAYPPCCYDDDCRTLPSCGLTTNATLLLRRRHSLTGVNQINL
ncbi:UBX domain-containing protein 11 isoform X2 [Seriola lalandi dorsalis]|uniref:UBX domain-containing protein 11 isoform X2 n=1 Tax=Seriola lalandi dorsalis TaxID=1841481 RepID=UPI000C6FC893|nr:UBX domain-containing protein 11 isoform X2 [Seriola lalandi dorsalis]